MTRTNKKDHGEETPKKKLSLAAKILLCLLALVLVAGAVAVALGLDLLNRVSRPEEDGFIVEGTPEPEEEYAPDQTPTPTRTPVATPTPHPSATPRPVLPVSEYYEQTYLTEEQFAKMAENNASDEFINVLLIGADRRATKGSYNSDTMMIATIDKRHGTLKLTTLMRDMLVNIPGHGYGKLNSAAARGGVELLFQTIEENFHITLTQYVLVDFYMFVDIIDALGGVTIEMTAEEISAANDCIAGLNKQLGVEYLWDGFIFADPGPVKLTGKQALGYSRIRKIDSEFARTKRQYTVLNTVLSMFRNVSLSKQYDILYNLLPMVETNMTNSEIIDAAISALTGCKGGLIYFRLPVEGYFENGKWNKKFVFFADLPGMAWELHEFIFDNDTTVSTAKLLTPNPSLPPRTPSPTGADGLYPEGTVYNPGGSGGSGISIGGGN